MHFWMNEQSLVEENVYGGLIDQPMYVLSYVGLVRHLPKKYSAPFKCFHPKESFHDFECRLAGARSAP